MAGAGYKLFNTGDVLTAQQVNEYLMQQTIMVFANSTARTTALSGVLAEGMTTYLQDTNSLEFWNGSAWVAAVGDITGVTAGTGLTGGGTSGTVTLTNDMATTITTKGDLVVGTGSGTYARLAAGEQGASIVADSAASTGLRWQPSNAAGKNVVINGGFDVWQRGTSFTVPTGDTYTADRFFFTRDGSGATLTVSRQDNKDAIGSNIPKFFVRANMSVAGSGANYNVIKHRIEDVATYAGQTVTVSFYAKAASTITLPAIELNQSFGSGGSSNANNTLATNVSVGTSWTRYSYTVTLGTLASKTIGANNCLEFILWMPANATYTLDLWGVQIELGSVATQFQRSGGTIQGELAACQRYYYRLNGTAGGWAGSGFADSTTRGTGIIAFPVTMRTAPTALEQSGTASDYTVRYTGGSVATCNAVPTFGSATLNTANVPFDVASGLTAGQGIALRFANTSGYLGWSAEL